MEAKDTVMGRMINESDDAYERRVKQAEITFKAGFNEALDTVVATRQYDTGQQAGIREAVEFVNSYGSSKFIWHSPEGKAKLKEWGL